MTEGPEPVPNPFSLAGRNAIASPAARFMTGQMVLVDGGFYLA